MFYIILVTLFALQSNGDRITKIIANKEWGVWEGWGTSLAWFANEFGDRDDVADILYSTKMVKFHNTSIPGLGYNIARYNVGGCSWNSVGTAHMIASPHMPKVKQIEGFWLNWDSEDPNSKSWDWTVDKKQRQLVQKAKERGADQIELFSNSPMWWMLDNHNPSGAANGGENLQTWNHKQFAVYLATVAKYAADHWNVSFVSVEPFNEASTTWWKAEGTQEGCHFGAANQQDIIKLLRVELDKRGLNKTMISASDENNYDLAIGIWNSFSSEVKAKVGRVNVHGYQYGGGKRDHLYDLVHKDGKALWNSEYGEGEQTGFQMADCLSLDMFWLHPTAWVHWQPIDGPGALNWGMIQILHDKDKPLGAINAKYYVMAQYSRHIRKGMHILGADHSDTVVAYDKSKSRLIIVGLNKDKAQNITYDLSQFSKIASGPVKRWTTNTGPGDRYVEHNDLHITSKSISVHFNEKSVQTIEINNVFNL